MPCKLTTPAPCGRGFPAPCGRGFPGSPAKRLGSVGAWPDRWPGTQLIQSKMAFALHELEPLKRRAPKCFLGSGTDCSLNSLTDSFRTPLDDILLSDRALQTDSAFRFQLPDDGDDLLLRRFYFLQLDGP